MEVLLGTAWRQNISHALLHRETGSLPCIKAPVLPFSSRERLRRGSLGSIQASANDTEVETMEVYGSLVQQTLGDSVEPFSRPTQLLTSQEVRIYSFPWTYGHMTSTDKTLLSRFSLPGN